MISEGDDPMSINYNKYFDITGTHYIANSGKTI